MAQWVVIISKKVYNFSIRSRRWMPSRARLMVRGAENFNLQYIDIVKIGGSGYSLLNLLGFNNLFRSCNLLSGLHLLISDN